MTVVVLNRFLSTPEATYGVMTMRDRVLCMTLEDPWLDNRRNVSCVPAGRYTVVPHTGLKYRNVWRLENVPNRTAILIHQGNTTNDTQGCILVGQWISPDQAFLNNSRNVLSTLRVMLPSTFVLEIKGDQQWQAPPSLDNKPPPVRQGRHALMPFGTP